MVQYEYTAYGKISSITGSLASTIGAYNPFRYKGYYYDKESIMYYRNSRYYNPEWCRWLTIDSVEYLEPGNVNGAITIAGVTIGTAAVNYGLSYLY